MKKECECGNIHCCHGKTREEVVKDEESGEEFIRKTCFDCGRWLGDRPN